MFRFSIKQRLAIKSYFHALPGTISMYLAPYFYDVVFIGKTPHFDYKTIVLALLTALLAPITRWLARLYSMLAIKYPWLKPFALYLAKRAAKKRPKATDLVDKALAGSKKPTTPTPLASSGSNSKP